MRLTTETFARRHTPLPRPMPLPMLPELKKKEEERRRGAVVLPSAPGAAPVQMAVIGTTSGSPVLWLARTMLRSLASKSLSALAPVATVVTAGLALGFAAVGLVHDPEYSEVSAAYIPHPAPAGAAAVPIRTLLQGPSSETLVRGSDGALPGAPAAAAVPAAASAEVPVAEAPEPAAEPAPEQAPQDPLRDAVASFKARKGRGGERLAWGGQAVQAVQPLGGEFLPLRAPRAAAAPKTEAGRRGTRSASLRRVANLKLGSSRFQPGSANRAMGQLKLASRVSSLSAQAPGVEAAKQGGGDAFEQGKSAGGEGLKLDAVPSTGLGGSAPDVTESAPALPAGENKTPYQDKVDSAKKKNSMTKVMLILGALLIAVGIALVVFADEIAGFLGGAAATIKAIGYALIGAGAAMVLAGFLMAKQAKKDAKDVGEQYGQKEQAAVIEDCADQSLGKQDCAPKAVAQPVNGVHEAVEAESQAGYTLGGEAGPAEGR